MAAPALHCLLTERSRAVSDCRAMLKPGDSVLLVDSGVALLAEPRWLDELAAIVPVQVLAGDAAARGLQAVAKAQGFALLSDSEWVDAVVHHEQILSWT